MFISTMQENAKTILFIMNDPTLISLYKEPLEAAEYLVDVAIGGEEGLTKILNNRYDLVLMQIILEKIQGLDVLSRFYKTGKPHGKIVVFDNLSPQNAAVKEAFELGVDGYELMVSLTPVGLATRVKGYLSGAITREESKERAAEEQ